MQIRAVPGYFKSFSTNDSPDVDSLNVNHLVIDENHANWKTLYENIPMDTANTQYKLLILARHGQGYHNAAMDRYGDYEFACKWGGLDGDIHGEWIDSKLTPLGQQQVSATGEEVLLPMIEELGFLPHKFFSSPMRRCLETFIGSWGRVFHEYSKLVNADGLKVHIFENIREILNGFQCNRRKNHSLTVGEYQDYVLEDSKHRIHWEYEPDYEEEDQLWLPDYQETHEQIDSRISKGLESIFTHVTTGERLISITCHLKVIDSILRVTKHPAVLNLGTAKVVCLVVEIRK